MHTVSQYNVSEVVWQCFWGRGTEKYGQGVVSAHGWVMMRTTLPGKGLRWRAKGLSSIYFLPIQKYSFFMTLQPKR